MISAHYKGLNVLTIMSLIMKAYAALGVFRERKKGLDLYNTYISNEILQTLY